MLRFSRAAAGLLLACAAWPATAQPSVAAPPVAQPARWHLHGAADRCVLTRQLQGSPGAATFILRTVPGSGQYEVILAGQGLAGEFGRWARDARIGIVGSDATFAAQAAAVDMPGELGKGLVVGPLPASFLDAVAKGNAVRLIGSDAKQLGSWTLPTGAKAAEAVAFCETEKLIEWGADREALEAGGGRPRPASDPAKWVTIRDFGLFNAAGPALFSVVFRVDVDPAGKATGCEVIDWAGNVDRAKQGFCRTIVRSARYEPARDARGNAVRSVAVHSLHYSLTTEFRPAL